MKQVTLMHKDTEVCTFLLNESGVCSRILSVDNPSHLPPNLSWLDSEADVNFWLSQRRLSDKRADVQMLQDSGVVSPKDFTPIHYLSLYDCYWIRYNQDERFENVTLYQQPVMDDVFSFMEDHDESQDLVLSRDTGNLTLPYHRECYCLQDEDDANIFYFLFRTEITEQPEYLLGKYRDFVPTVDGDYFVLYDSVYFRFRNMTSPAMEYISAKDLFDGYNRNPLYKGLEPETILFRAIDDAKIPDARKFLSGMIAMDDKYHIRRDLSTFGYFRDPDTLQSFGFAPLFLWPMA